MFESPATTITIIVVLAAVGVGIGVFSLRRRRQVQRLCSEGAKALEGGRNDEARRMLLAAERGWSFNAHSGSRSSLLSDLDDFSAILSLLTRLPGDTAPHVARVEAAATEMRALLSDRSSFGLDGRSMNREAALRWVELSGRFQKLRQELKENLEKPNAAS
jgi:hypothetical protein